ncbi:SDR family NAD(P)-dependent oxidoreductase [Alistipes sp.]|uniref:SDR family NAD(P)-dependent oxidoreductase n=1 Tax=Alistipes sp. TaxID=1872444 RepID=UPI003AF02CBC
MKRIVIVGATSGLGLELARQCIRKGWSVGAAGRRAEALTALQAEAPGQVAIQPLDVTHDDAPQRLDALIERLGGMDVYFHAAGIGSRNTELRPDIELATLRTNGEGFVRLVTSAFGYFRAHGGGRIAAISSIAGTRGLGPAPAYSATKRMQSTYLDALSQLARTQRLGIRFTDIRPGFVDTPMLHGDYPMRMRPEKVARAILQALESGRRRIVIDDRYAALVFLWRLIPAALWERIRLQPKA